MTDRLPGGNAGLSVTPDRVVDRLAKAGLTSRWIGSPPASFEAFQTDSRSIEPGGLFCAISGTVADGHDYAPQAEARGAFACVVERALDDVRVPLLLTPDTRLAASVLASLFAGEPGQGLRLVGVTGTNGKTSTTLLLQHLLTPLGPAAALGTLGVWPSVAPEAEARSTTAAGVMTTPGPVELMAELSRLQRGGTQLLAMEVSSHALDQKRVDALEFECVAFTNLTRDHLNYHADMADYRATKLRLARLLAPGGTAVVNADEPAWRDADFEYPVVTFGLAEGADVRALDVQTDIKGSRFLLSAHGQEIEVALPLLGSVSVINSLGAIAAALSMGLDADLPNLLASMSQIPGRMEILASAPGLIVRDYAHTPDALSRATLAMRELTPGRAITLFGCGGDRDRGKRPLMGRAAAENADLLLVTQDNSRSEDPTEIVADIVAGLPDGTYEVLLDRREAIEHGIGLLRAGDSLLLAGKGHETYQILAGETTALDEAAIVADLLDSGPE